MSEDLCYGFQPWDFSDVVDVLDDFMDLYDKRPVKNNKGGMLSAHLFWAYYATKHLNPDNIIESGCFKGQGTWLFRKACPDANIFSIDPVLDQRVYIDDKAIYFTEDFSIINWDEYIQGGETLCFFDDHQNAYNRLQQMKWMGFKQAIFEDNYPVGRGDCYSLKQVFGKCGFQCDGKGNIPPNDVHAYFTRKNIETYTTFPPLYKTTVTRWGDAWEDAKYPTGAPLLLPCKVQGRFEIIKDEAQAYTWICYVSLKRTSE